MNRPEQLLQQQAASFITAAYPDLLFFHPANATGNRGARLGGIMKSMGLRAGVPDLVFVMPTGFFAAIELKAGKGSLSPAQRDWRDGIKASGALWAEARSLPEISEILDRWLTPLGWIAKARIAA